MIHKIVPIDRSNIDKEKFVDKGYKILKFLIQRLCPEKIEVLLKIFLSAGILDKNGDKQ